MITSTSLVIHHTVFDYIFSNRGKIKYHLLYIFFLWMNDCCLSFIPINSFSLSQQVQHCKAYYDTP